MGQQICTEKQQQPYCSTIPVGGGGGGGGGGEAEGEVWWTHPLKLAQDPPTHDTINSAKMFQCSAYETFQTSVRDFKSIRDF